MAGNSSFKLWVSTLFLAALMLSGTAWGAVSLEPRVSEGIIRDDDEDYVYFGKYPHGYIASDTGNNVYENTATPILWRVMSVDRSPNPTGAVLLSHYLLETSCYKNDGSNNVWSGSTLQTWLNAAAASVDLCDWEESSHGRPGFLHADHFTAGEKSRLSSPYLDGVAAMTSPSEVEIGVLWFDDDSSRIAKFKGGGDGGYYLRTPARRMDTARIVGLEGDLRSHYVYSSLGVRPAFFLNLEAFIFKSGSVFGSSLSTPLPSADAAGSPNNPYKLYTKWEATPELSVETGGTLKLDFGIGNVIDSVDQFPQRENFALISPAGTAISAVTANPGETFILLTTTPAVSENAHVVLSYIVPIDRGGMLRDGAVVNKGTTEAMGSGCWEINSPPSR